uniref:APS_reductase n=1 Tax=Enterobacter cloacae TaxID=550 RepID=A0A286NCH2_ENTCL|nr:APS_reductase [Enterobacter cloacae]
MPGESEKKCSVLPWNRTGRGPDAKSCQRLGSETLCLFRYIDGNECVQAKKNRLQRRFLKGMALTSPGQNHSQAGESRFFRYDTPQVLQRI